MEKQIIDILKKEDRLMSASEIFIELKKTFEDTTKEEEVKVLLQALSAKNVISVISTIDDDKYCFVEDIKPPHTPQTTTTLNPEIKKINTKIAIISALIVVVFIGFIAFAYGLVYSSGWGAIGLLLSLGANLALGFLAGPSGKLMQGFDNWTENSLSKNDADGCTNTMRGCAGVGCGYIIFVPTFAACTLIGFIFGIIAIKKLYDKKYEIK